MRTKSDPGRTRRAGGGRLLVAGATGLAAGLAMMLQGFVTAPQSPPQPDRREASSVLTAVPDPALKAAPRPLGFSPPTRIEVPRLTIDASVLPMGLNDDRTVEVPTPDQAAKAGWYESGAAPGQRGPTVILGHVDSSRLPDNKAVFYRLGEARRGDRVDITRTDGAVARYVVEAAIVVAKSDFPTRTVYGSAPTPVLRLVTCGGSYTKDSGYDSNVIVYARYVGQHRRNQTDRQRRN
ncbi:class F sortase [Streptomyces globisporus]|uniref:class F sortase n=1 Tax=Streptomyces globisporus TaxID=1908 RepID=UPI0037A7BF57